MWYFYKKKSLLFIRCIGESETRPCNGIISFSSLHYLLLGVHALASIRSHGLGRARGLEASVKYSPPPRKALDSYSPPLPKALESYTLPPPSRVRKPPSNAVALKKGRTSPRAKLFPPPPPPKQRPSRPPPPRVRGRPPNPPMSPRHE